MSKIRKQIYLTRRQNDKLAELSAKTGASEAEIIRSALDAYLLALEVLPKGHPLSELVGMGASSTGDYGAQHHDRIIYG